MPNSTSELGIISLVIDELTEDFPDSVEMSMSMHRDSHNNMVFSVGFDADFDPKARYDQIRKLETRAESRLNKDDVGIKISIYRL